ncbi:MAG: MFS transporter [Eubacteriales bacterium]|nr:MFS transporter [Eubacteriales bacterium]
MNIGNSKDKLLDSKPRVCFFIQTAFGTAFTYLTSGVFLSGLAILMGAGDVLVSYLSVIVNICGVLILIFASFLERFQSRKRLTIVLTVLSRAATLFIVAIPAFVPGRFRLMVFIPAVIAAFTLQAQTTVALNQWMMGFMDESKSGRYISLRQTLTLIVTVALSVAGGRWMDVMQGKYKGFVILFTAAGLMSVCEIILLARTPDSQPYCSTHRSRSLRDIGVIPLRNRKFTGFVLYIMTFYLLLNISDSFTMVYMMKYLALPYQTVTTMSMILSLPQILLLGIWGKISDRRGHEFVLKTSVWLFAGETLFLVFAAPNSWFVFIPVAFLISSVANAGFVIAVFNRRYELMPEENRIVYDNFYTAVLGIGFILGPMLGGFIKNMLQTSTFLEEIMPFASIRLLYSISTAGILLLQLVYCHAHKTKEECVLCEAFSTTQRG